MASPFFPKGASMQQVISALGVISAVTFAVAPQFTSIQPKTAAVLTLIGTAVSALSGALVKYGAGNRVITGLGAALAVVSVGAGATDVLPGNVTLVLSIIGTALAAVGKSLFDWSDLTGGGKLPLILIPVLGLSTLGAAGCDRGREFAATLDRVSGYVATGLQIVDEQTAAGTMSPETGAAIVTTLRQINTVNGRLVSEAKQYVTPDGKLSLTVNGQTALLNIVGSSRSVAVKLLTDPRITSLPEAEQAKWVGVINNLTTTLDLIAEIVKTAKVKGA